MAGSCETGGRSADSCPCCTDPASSGVPPPEQGAFHTHNTQALPPDGVGLHVRQQHGGVAAAAPPEGGPPHAAVGPRQRTLRGDNRGSQGVSAGAKVLVALRGGARTRNMRRQGGAGMLSTPSTTTACTPAATHHSILLVRAVKGTQPLASPDLPHMRHKLRGRPGARHAAELCVAWRRLLASIAAQRAHAVAIGLHAQRCQTTGAEPLTCGRPRLSGNSEKVSMYFSQGENSRRCTLGCLHTIKAAKGWVVVSGRGRNILPSEEGRLRQFPSAAHEYAHTLMIRPHTREICTAAIALQTHPTRCRRSKDLPPQSATPCRCTVASTLPRGDHSTNASARGRAGTASGCGQSRQAEACK